MTAFGVYNLEYDKKGGMNMMINGKNGSQYFLKKQVAKGETFNLHLVTDENGTERLLSIAATAFRNGAMDLEAFVLKSLAAKTAKRRESGSYDPKMQPLEWHFPTVIETFPFVEQDNRHVTILGFVDLVNVGGLLALPQIRSKNFVVDLKTSVWMVGKLLKMLRFAHENGISVGRITPNRVLLGVESERRSETHRVILMDYTHAKIHESGVVPREVARREISDVAETMMSAALFCDSSVDLVVAEEEKAYAEILHALRGGTYADATKAHVEFYRVARELWGSAYHPFTVKQFTRS